MYIKYKTIEDFYETIKKLIYQNNISKNNRNFIIDYIKNSFDIKVLKSYYIVGSLKENEMEAIQAKTANIKFSAETMIKNILNHNELTVNDYKNIEKYIKNADYILQSGNKNLIYFKIDNKIYQAVIKTTKDKQENFLTTFHKSSNQQLNKDLKRYKQIKR